MSDQVSENSNSVPGRYLQFNLGTEAYGIPLLTVKEVIPPPETTSLPNTPAHYIGIMNLRGQIISIIDLRKRLKISSSQEEAEKAVIIVEVSGVGIGLIVDSINSVISVSPEAFSHVPEVNSQVNSKYIQGVYKSDEGLTIFLDIEGILNINEIKKIEQAS